MKFVPLANMNMTSFKNFTLSISHLYGLGKEVVQVKIRMGYILGSCVMFYVGKVGLKKF